MNTPLLVKEFEPTLRAMLSAQPEIAHEIAKFIKGLPVEVHNKIVKMCYTNDAKLIDYEKISATVTAFTYGFRLKEDKDLYEVTLEKFNNKIDSLSIFKESLRNGEEYSSLELKIVEKQQLKEMTSPITLGSYTRHYEEDLVESADFFAEVTHEYKINKQKDESYFVTIELDENLERSNYYLPDGIENQYEVNEENLFTEAELERE